jgi:hypothetical protein
MRCFRLFAVGLVLALPMAGCGDDTSQAVTSGSAYVDRVEAVLDPAAKMAQLVTAPLRNPPGPWPSAAEVEKVLDDASGALRDLRDVSLSDAGLREQRARLVDAYAVALGHMRDVGRDLDRRDRGGLRADSTPFFASLRDLSSSR